MKQWKIRKVKDGYLATMKRKAARRAASVNTKVGVNAYTGRS